MIYQTIQKCRISKKKDLVSVGKFGGMALTGTFPKSRNQKIPYLPFEVVYSKSSTLLQLKHNYNPKILYGDNYGYLSGLNPVMIKHLKTKSSFGDYDYASRIGSRANKSCFFCYFKCIDFACIFYSVFIGCFVIVFVHIDGSRSRRKIIPRRPEKT